MSKLITESLKVTDIPDLQNIQNLLEKIIITTKIVYLKYEKPNLNAPSIPSTGTNLPVPFLMMNNKRLRYLEYKDPSDSTKNLGFLSNLTQEELLASGLSQAELSKITFTNLDISVLI